MVAVGKAALGGKRLDIGEGLGQVAAVELQFAHTGGVDDDRAARQSDQLPKRRGVATGAVLSDFQGLQAVFAEQPVDQGRLADAGGTDERDGLAGLQVLGDRQVAVLAKCGGEQDVDADGDVAGFGQPCVQVVAQVALGQYHDRDRTAVPGDGQVAFQAAQAKILVQRHTDEQVVDIGGDDLSVDSCAGGLAAKHGPARQDAADDGVAAGVVQAVDQDPVAHCRVVRRVFGQVAELAGDDCLHLATLADDAVMFLVLDRYAGQKTIRVLRSLP